MSDNTVSFGDLMNEAKTAVVLPIGEYPMKVTKCDTKTASTGKLMNVVELTVISGAQTNRKMWNNFVLVADNPRALRMFFMNMAAFGLDDAYFKALQGLTPEIAMKRVGMDLVGRIAMITIEHREWNNAPSENVTKIKLYQGGPQGIGAPMNTGIMVQSSVHGSPIPVGGAPGGIPAPFVAQPAPAAPAPVYPPVAPSTPPPTPAPEPAVVPIPEPVYVAPAPVQEVQQQVAEAVTPPAEQQPVSNPPPPPVIF